MISESELAQQKQEIEKRFSDSYGNRRWPKLLLGTLGVGSDESRFATFPPIVRAPRTMCAAILGCIDTKGSSTNFERTWHNFFVCERFSTPGTWTPSNRTIPIRPSHLFDRPQGRHCSRASSHKLNSVQIIFENSQACCSSADVADLTGISPSEASLACRVCCYRLETPRCPCPTNFLPLSRLADFLHQGHSRSEELLWLPQDLPREFLSRRTSFQRKHAMPSVWLRQLVVHSYLRKWNRNHTGRPARTCDLVSTGSLFGRGSSHCATCAQPRETARKLELALNLAQGQITDLTQSCHGTDVCACHVSVTTATAAQVCARQCKSVCEWRACQQCQQTKPRGPMMTIRGNARGLIMRNLVAWKLIFFFRTPLTWGYFSHLWSWSLNFFLFESSWKKWKMTPHLCACAVVMTLETQICRKRAPRSVEFNFFIYCDRSR